MNKTYKQYRKTFDFSDAIYDETVRDNSYVKYVISIQYFDSSNNNPFIQNFKEMFEGKSILINRKTTIDFTDIINELRFRDSYIFNIDNQGYTPRTYITLPNPNTQSIENNEEIVNTKIRVAFYSTFNEDTIETFNFPISIFEKEINQPYENFQLPNIKCYNYELMEIPYIKTFNYTITIPFATYDNQKGHLRTNNSGNVNITNGVKGNYINSYSLNNIISTLEQSSNDLVITYIGGDSDLTLSGGLSLNDATPIKALRSEEITTDILANGNELYLNDIHIGNFIPCYDEWYLGWLDKRGYHSISLKQVELVREKTNIQILNIYNETNTISTDIQQQFKIKTKRLSNEQYNNFLNILEASNVVLYNTINDISYICNINENQLSYIHNNGFKEIELTLTNNVKNNH